jgi:hypothetical protein
MNRRHNFTQRSPWKYVLLISSLLIAAQISGCKQQGENGNSNNLSTSSSPAPNVTEEISATVENTQSNAECTDQRFGQGDPKNTLTALSLTTKGLSITLCATNLTGCSVYAYAWRDDVPGIDPYVEQITLTAPSKVIDINFPSDPNERKVPPGTLYHTVISMTPIDVSKLKSVAGQSQGCFVDTNGLQMCDSVQAGATSTPPPNVLCETLR